MLVASEALKAPLVLEYPFTRSTGPVIGAFLTGLKAGVICGIRRADGSVLCPPLEYDPLTSQPLSEMVEVKQSGTVVTWAWNGAPRPQQPFERPFAWALIRLDGADTAMLHAVLINSAEEMATGMRVRAVWRDQRQGHIADIAGFEPEQSAGQPSTTQQSASQPSAGRQSVEQAGAQSVDRQSVNQQSVNQQSANPQSTGQQSTDPKSAGQR